MSRSATVALGALVIGLAGAFAIARATLPQTSCSVSHVQYRALPMEVSYDKAKALLGCAGVPIAEGSSPTAKTYAWRADALPYGRVDAEFVNDLLKRKSIRALYGVGWTAETTQY